MITITNVVYFHLHFFQSLDASEYGEQNGHKCLSPTNNQLCNWLFIMLLSHGCKTKCTHQLYSVIVNDDIFFVDFLRRRFYLLARVEGVRARAW